MPKFAHLSDIHIGAFRQQELKDLLLSAFESAMDRCVSEKVEFIIISGDIFDSNIPDLSSVRRATQKMKEVSDRGIRLYVVYGSHDFSPNFASIVDVLEGAGLFSMVERNAGSEGQLRLGMVKDPSGAKICGISGKKLSLDREDYKSLDRESLEAESGLRIFVFHGALEEMRPSRLEKMEAMPVSYLPSGFSYYAGGHLHAHAIESFPGHPNVAYPGPIFATEYSELVPLAHGEERGFFLVDFDEKEVRNVEFMPVKVCEVVELSYSADGKTPGQVSEQVKELVADAELEGKVALLTVGGELREGKTADVDFLGIRRQLAAGNPKIALTNYSHLSSKELRRQIGAARAPHATERELFHRQIQGVQSEDMRLRGEKGVALSLDLLKTLKEERKENENKGEYQLRTERAGLRVLDLKDEA